MVKNMNQVSNLEEDNANMRYSIKDGKRTWHCSGSNSNKPAAKRSRLGRIARTFTSEEVASILAEQFMKFLVFADDDNSKSYSGVVGAVLRTNRVCYKAYKDWSFNSPKLSIDLAQLLLPQFPLFEYLSEEEALNLVCCNKSTFYAASKSVMSRLKITLSQPYPFKYLKPIILDLSKRPYKPHMGPIFEGCEDMKIFVENDDDMNNSLAFLPRSLRVLHVNITQDFLTGLPDMTCLPPNLQKLTIHMYDYCDLTIPSVILNRRIISQKALVIPTIPSCAYPDPMQALDYLPPSLTYLEIKAFGQKAPLVTSLRNLPASLSSLHLQCILHQQNALDHLPNGLRALSVLGDLNLDNLPSMLSKLNIQSSSDPRFPKPSLSLKSLPAHLDSLIFNVPVFTDKDVIFPPALAKLKIFSSLVHVDLSSMQHLTTLHLPSVNRNIANYICIPDSLEYLLINPRAANNIRFHQSSDPSAVLAVKFSEFETKVGDISTAIMVLARLRSLYSYNFMQ